MSSLDKAVETQLRNIEIRSGKSLAELENFVRQSGLTGHSQVREMLKQELGLGHGDANTLVHYIFKSDGERAAQVKGLSQDDVLDEIYSGTKAPLRPVHDLLMQQITKLGDFEQVPKKGYVSLRRKKQFAMIGPVTKTRVEIGLNMKGIEGTERLLAQPPGSMCNFIVKLLSLEQVDDELAGWIRIAFEQSG